MSKREVLGNILVVFDDCNLIVNFQPDESIQPASVLCLIVTIGLHSLVFEV